jgi:lipopolysaccharide biosynthesis glycosyltransferase
MIINFKNKGKLFIAAAIALLTALSSYNLYQIRKIRKNPIITVNTQSNDVYHSHINTLHETSKYYYDRVYSQLRRAEFDFEVELAKLELANLSAQEKQQLEKRCRFELEEATSKTTISKAYHCISVLQSQKNEALEQYQAIKNISYSLELIYSEKSAKHLAQLITGQHLAQIKASIKDFSEEKLSQAFNGSSASEVAFLEELLALDIAGLSGKIYYRLSMIHQFGRSSVFEEAEPNLVQAVDAQHKATEFASITPKNELDIVLIINEPYAPHAATTIASALVNSNLDTLYNFHFVVDPNDPISAESKAKLNDMQHIRKYNLYFHTLDLRTIPVDLIKSKFVNCKWPLLISFRPFLADILPNLKSALSLDTDLLVLRDLSYFKTINMDGYMVAGAYDAGNPVYYDSRCKHAVPYTYINAGVMWFNLDNMRKYQANKDVVDNLQNTQCLLEMFEQDIINISFISDRVKFLSYRWNHTMNYDSPVNVNYHTRYILHYSGTKPWAYEHDKTPKAYQEYWLYRQLTPWKP